MSTHKERMLSYDDYFNSQNDRFRGILGTVTVDAKRYSIDLRTYLYINDLFEDEKNNIKEAGDRFREEILAEHDFDESIEEHMLITKLEARCYQTIEKGLSEYKSAVRGYLGLGD